MARGKPTHEDFFQSIIRKRLDDLIRTIEVSPLTAEQRAKVAVMSTKKLLVATCKLTREGLVAERETPLSKIAKQISAHLADDLRKMEEAGKL